MSRQQDPQPVENSRTSGLSPDELEKEQATDLPDREAMSTMQPDIFMPWPAPVPPDEIA
jgi:hypothetical protein